MNKVSDLGTQCRYSGIEVNTEFWYLTCKNSGIFGSKNSHFLPKICPRLGQLKFLNIEKVNIIMEELIMKEFLPKIWIISIVNCRKVAKITG